MGAAKTIKKILIDKELTITELARQMKKPRQTVANTFYVDKMSTQSVLEYADALGCTLFLRDNETGREYEIYNDSVASKTPTKPIDAKEQSSQEV